MRVGEVVKDPDCLRRRKTNRIGSAISICVCVCVCGVDPLTWQLVDLARLQCG